MNNWQKSMLDIVDDYTEFRFDFTKYLDQSTRYNGYRYFWEMIPMIRFTVNKDFIGCTDSDFNIFLNIPHEAVATENDAWEFVFYHECLHQLYDTFGVEKNIVKQLGKVNHDVLNVASDVVINDYLKVNCGIPYPSDRFMTPEYIKEKYGVEYNRREDDQYDLYVKLKEVEDQIADDPLVQQLREGAPIFGDDEEAPEMPQVKTKRIPTSDEWKRGSKEMRKELNDILEECQKKVKKSANGKMSMKDALAALEEAEAAIEAKFGHRTTVNVVDSNNYVMTTSMFIAENSPAGSPAGKPDWETYEGGREYALGDVLNQLRKSIDELKGLIDKKDGKTPPKPPKQPKAPVDPNDPTNPQNQEVTQEIPENDPSEEEPFLPKVARPSKNKNKDKGKDENKIDVDDLDDMAESPYEDDDDDQSNDNNRDDQKSNKDTSNMSAEAAANEAQDAADKAQDAAKDAQDSADKAKDAANEAQDAADKAQENADQEQQQSGSNSDAAKEAQKRADKAKSKAKNAKKNAEKAQDAADKAKDAAANAQDYADEAKADADEGDAESARENARKAQEENNKAQDAAKDAADAADAAESDAEDAKDLSEGKDLGDKPNSSKPDKNGKDDKNKRQRDTQNVDNGEDEDADANDTDAVWQRRRDIKAEYDKKAGKGTFEKVLTYAYKLPDMSKVDAQNLTRKFASAADKTLGDFVRKCNSSVQKCTRGIIVKTQLQKRNVSWAEKFSDSIKNTIRQNVKRRTTEWYNTYRKANRRQGVVKEGDILKKGKMRQKDKLTISVAFYIDISGSMDSTNNVLIGNIFKYAYKIDEKIRREYAANPVVDGSVFEYYTFDTVVRKIKKPNISKSSGGGTMPLLQLVDTIGTLSKDYMINVIVTDAAMDFSIGKLKASIKELPGNIIFVTNNQTVGSVLQPLTSMITFGNNKKFDLITVADDFAITDKDFKQV